MSGENCESSDKRLSRLLFGDCSSPGGKQRSRLPERVSQEAMGANFFGRGSPSKQEVLDVIVWGVEMVAAAMVEM